MIFLLAFVSLVNHATFGTRTYEECQKSNWSLERACAPAKRMHDIGKKACELQGKPFNGKSC